MKVWREGTTTSPSGRHLGDYKSLFTVINKSLEATERKKSERDTRKDSWMICSHNQLRNSSQLFIQKMETNIEFYDLQRKGKCEDPLIESNSYTRPTTTF